MRTWKSSVLILLVSVLFFSYSPSVFAADVADAAAVDVIVDDTAGTIEYIFPGSNVSVTTAFSDIPDGAWYNMFVSYLKQTGLVDGVSETEFAPNEFITRGEYIKLISLLSDEQINSSFATASFADIDDNQWYRPYVEWAAKNKIILGDEVGNFNGDQWISKEEAITILYRFAQTYKNHIFEQSVYLEQDEYSDSEQISEWASDAVNEMTNVGIIQGYDGNFHPNSCITRAEAAKIVALYDIFNERPIIVGEHGTTLEYIGISESNGSVSTPEMIHEQENDPYDAISAFAGEFITIGDVPPLTDDNADITPSWGGLTHASMLERSFSILAEDNNNGKTPVYVHNLSLSIGSLIDTSSGKLSFNARKYISSGSVAPDNDEQGDYMAWHYYKYSPDLVNGIGTTKFGYPTTAYHKFNNHYYDAKCWYAAGNYTGAYEKLGRSIHYLEDINAPHHAMLINNESSNNNHTKYETWVREHFYSEYWERGSASSSYPFVCNSSFRYMSNSFSKAACERYSQCANFESAPGNARTVTAGLTKRTQRAVAGLLYRFLVDTGRAN